MNKKPPLSSPVLLDKSHKVDPFDCDNRALNEYLHKFALTNTQSGSSRTYVTCRGNQVIGYYTIAAGSVRKTEEVPLRVKEGLAGYPIPVVLLARLAVDKNERGSGIGTSLLQYALLSVVRAADIIGVRAIVVEAKNKKAKDFYKQFGFESSHIDEYHLYLLIKDIKKTLGI